MIRIAALAMVTVDRRMLLVRKRGTIAFMQPGGKIDPGEDAVAALVRELNEELRFQAPAADLNYLGVFEAPAANEPHMRVHAELFAYRAAIKSSSMLVKPAAEIEEAIWYPDQGRPNVALAPLTQFHVLPAMGM